MPELYGVARIFSNFEGHRRALEDIAPSPMHALGFCMGTWSEMSVDTMFHGLEYFGERGKLGYLHFRNIRGVTEDFEETFIDEGDFDVVKAMQIINRVGFDGFMMDDHVPHMANDTRWPTGDAPTDRLLQGPRAGREADVCRFGSVTNNSEERNEVQVHPECEPQGPAAVGRCGHRGPRLAGAARVRAGAGQALCRQQDHLLGRSHFL